MLKKLKTMHSGTKTFEPPNEPSPKKEVDQEVKEILSADFNLMEHLGPSFQPEHKHRPVKAPLNLEEFEKEVDLSEKARHFNFRFDDEEDNSMSSSLNSQRIDMVEGDEQANLKAGDASIDRGRQSVTGANQNAQQNKEEVKEAGGNEKRPSEREHLTKVPETMLNVSKKSARSMNALEEGEMSSYVERTFDESNDALDAKYRDDAQYNKYKWILFPDDYLRFIWDIIIALNLLYTATLVPYSVSFIDNPGAVLTFLDIVSDCVWGIDIVLTFNSAYEDKEDNLIVSRKRIAINYLTGWFVIDFISILPFDTIFNMDHSFNAFLRLAKLPKLARFIRLAKLVRMMRFMKEGSKIARGLSDWLKFRPGMDRFFMTIAFFFIFCHLACCVWYMQASFNSDDDTNWVTRNDLDDAGKFAQYISSFYFIIATIVTVGYGDIHAGNTLERIVAVFLMFLGAFFYSFIIGSLSSVILNLDSKHRDLEKKINTLIEIRQKYALDNVMFNKIKRALKFGYSRNEEDNINFLNDLPLPLRTKLSVVMHKDLLKNIIFFKPKSDRFLATIGPLLKPQKIGINEYIFTEGEYANEMYFIKSGTVQMVIKEYNNFPFMYVEQGYYFGEVDLLFGETRKHSYQSKSECELLTLSKKNFTKVFFQDFPDVGAEIYNNALKRRVRAHKTYKDALDQCKNEARDKGRRKTTTKFVPQTSQIPAKLEPLDKSSSDDDTPSDTHPSHPSHAQIQNQAQQEEKAALEKGNTSAEDRLKKEESNPGTVSKPESSSISSAPRTIEVKQETLLAEIHEEPDSGAKSEQGGTEAPAPIKAENDTSLFKGIKKPMGKWSLLRNKFESNVGGAGSEKKIEIGTPNSRGAFPFLHSEPAAQAMNSDQVHLLQQRVDQLEKSIEKILELYQSVIPKDDD